MKKVISIITFISVLLVSSCANSQYINGQLYKPKGIINYNEINKNIKYSISVGNCIWGIILIETIIVPIIIVGFFLWEPENKQ